TSLRVLWAPSRRCVLDVGDPDVAAGRRRRRGAVPTGCLRVARPVRRRDRRRRFGASLRGRPPALLRPGRAAHRLWSRPAVLVAAVGVGNLDRARGDAFRGQPRGGDPQMKKLLGLMLALTLVGAACTKEAPSPIVVGAIYPLSGPQGAAGTEEFDGVLLA